MQNGVTGKAPPVNLGDLKSCCFYFEVGCKRNFYVYVFICENGRLGVARRYEHKGGCTGPRFFLFMGRGVCFFSTG